MGWDGMTKVFKMHLVFSNGAEGGPDTAGDTVLSLLCSRMGES